ncbi:MAG TPA: prepilin-type N-terminal cleavage/methylation domain-containing protein [Acidobacteriota bacterium]|jgi:prepilin-type N-terminal cleavage/methylation domain-containing protein
MKNQIRQRGFTFLELMVSITILAILSGGVFTLFNATQKRYQAEKEYAETVQNARVALDLLSRCIRQAGNNEDPAAFAFEPLSYAGSTLTIRSDLTGSIAGGSVQQATGDPDGKLTAAYETITINFNSSSKQIVLNAGYGEEILAENINKLEFKFYDSAGVETATMNDVSKVSITLEALSNGSDPQSGKRNSIKLSSNVYLRSKSFTPFT